MEKNFLQLLNDVIGDYSDVRVSAMTGIERTRINRIRKGKFKIEFDELKKIISAFYVENADAKDLYDAFLHDKLGADKYKSRQLAKEFLSNLNINEDTPQVKVSNLHLDLPHYFDDDNELITFRGLTSVRNAIIITIFNAQSKGEKIRIISNPDDDFIISNLFTICSAYPELEIEHLYSLVNDDQLTSPLTYYITTAKAIYPIFMQNTNYKAYYNTGSYTTNDLMPYHIISESYSLSISSDYKFAMVSKNKEIIEIYSKIFDEKVKSCTPLINHIETIDMYLQHYCQIVKKTQLFAKNLFYSLDYEPCVLSFLNEKELFSCVQGMKDFPNIHEMLTKFVSDYYKTFKKNKQISFFTKKGLHSFLDTGKIAEIPDALGLVVSPERRIEIIKLVLEIIKNQSGNKVFYLLNENEFDPPMGLRFLGSGYKTDHLFVISNDKDGTRSILSLSNPITVSIVFDFFESLPESNMVYSNDETIAYIENVLNNYHA